MKITGLFSLYGAAFFVVTVSLAGLTLWNIDRTRFWDDRIALAQTSYNEHLTLQANIYMLLKQYGDALIIGDRDEGRGERMLSTQIANSITRIREVIAREIELVGEEEYEELELLSRIEKDVERLTSLLGRLGDDGAPMSDEFRMARLVDVLDRQIDVNLSSMINEALEEELEEVMETEAEAAAFRTTSRQVVIGIVAIAMAILGICGISYWRLVRRPISELREAVGDFGAGRFDRRARVSGGAELRELSRVLNDMAARLAAREATSKEQNELLEARVSERTKELEELLGRIEQSEENRRQLMADISHELRTPLAIIQGEAEVTLRGGQQTPEVYSDALARIMDSARHTVRIVNDLLLISRQEAGQLRLELSETNLRYVLHEAVKIFPGKVETTDELTQEPRVRADIVRMRQCLLAVFQNAKRYGGSEINAILHNNDAGFTISIDDNGPGMSDAERAHAFDRFFRGNDSSRGDNEGTGLGLPIVRSIMEAHGGTATLDTAPNGGLRVNLTLPHRSRISVVSTDDGAEEEKTGPSNQSLGA